MKYESFLIHPKTETERQISRPRMVVKTLLK